MTHLEKALYIAKFLEERLPSTMHIGLTGGTLYKDGVRKDIDFVVYSHKCYQGIETDKLARLLDSIGFLETVNFGRVIKCKFIVDQEMVDVDVIVPESIHGEYAVEPSKERIEDIL